MEAILSNGFFWVFLMIGMVVVVGHLTNRPEKPKEKA